MFGFGSKNPPPPPASSDYIEEPNSFSSDATSSSTSYVDHSASEDIELKKHLLREQQRAQFQEQVNKFNDMCWETCIDKPSSRLDSKTETCIANCVNRFIDVNLLLAQRFAQMLQQSGGL